MRRLLFGLAVAVLSLLLGPANAFAQAAKAHTFYVHVVDDKGAPIANLGPTDFGVIEGGAARKVARASYGGLPLRILFLVDTSEAISKIITPYRAGEQALIDGIPPEDEIALVSMGKQMRIRAQPTLDRKKIKSEAGSVFSEGGGTVLLDSLVEANDRVLAKSEDHTPMIVLLTAGGPESSTSVREEDFNKLVQNLMARGTVVHAVVMAETATSNPSSASAGLQSIVAQNLTQNTGGHLDSINTPTSLADKLGAIAGLIRAQQEKLKGWYQIDYASPTDGPGQALDVTVSRMDAKFELSNTAPR